MTGHLDQLHEQVAVNRQGQSLYAPPGERSRDQREHDGLEALKLIEKVAFAAGRAEGYEAGLRAAEGRIGEWSIDQIDAAIATREPS